MFVLPVKVRVVVARLLYFEQNQHSRSGAKVIFNKKAVWSSPHTNFWCWDFCEMLYFVLTFKNRLRKWNSMQVLLSYFQCWSTARKLWYLNTWRTAPPRGSGQTGEQVLVNPLVNQYFSTYISSELGLGKYHSRQVPDVAVRSLLRNGSSRPRIACTFYWFST